MLVGIIFPIPLQIYTDFALMQVKPRENAYFVNNFNRLLTNVVKKHCFSTKSVVVRL